MSEDRRVIVVLGAGGALGGAISAQLAGEPDTDLLLSDLSEELANGVDHYAVALMDPEGNEFDIN